MLKIYLPVILLFSLQTGTFCYGNLLSDSLVVSDINIEGNFVTDKKLIFRELAFKLNERNQQ